MSATSTRPAESRRPPEEAVHTALASGERPPRPGPVSTCLTFAWRGMLKGVVDRFRSLPIWRPSPMVGAVVGDSVRYVLAATVVVLLGVVMGFSAEAGIGGVVAAIAPVVVFAFGLSWVFTTGGLLMRAPNAVMNTGFMALFPLIFLSNSFVAPETLPGWLEAFVDVNPISHLTTAVRGLMAGTASAGDVGLALATAAALTAAFAPLTVRLYRGKG